jgi:transposase
MKQKYSEAFIEQAVVKLLSRGKRTVREVALDINVNHHTAKNWMQRGSPDKAAASPTKEKRPQDWSAQEQLLALQETHVLSGEALQAWCRERGLFAHHLTSWEAAFCTAEKKRMQARGNCAASKIKTINSNVNWCAKRKPWRKRPHC